MNAKISVFVTCVEVIGGIGSIQKNLYKADTL